MSLPPDQVLISADDHLDIHAMPPDVWSSRLPKEWRERGPHVEETPEGPYWFCDGRRVSPSGRKDTGYIAAHDHGFRPGQPQTRLEDMDRDGVRAQVVYGPTCTQLHITDAALHEQVARVYNDWAAEFQREAPDRLVLLPDIPSYDPQVARRELERCAKLGHKGAIVSSTVGRGKPLFDDDWTVFWDAAQEIGIPIHAHLSGGLHSLTMKLGSWRHARRRRRGPDAARRDALGIDLLGHPREAPARQVRDGRGGPGLDPVRDRAARPRAAQVRLEDPATTRSRCCPARSSRGRCSPPTRTRSSASS